MSHRSVNFSLESTFSAIADPTRRAVLDLLLHGRQPAGQIARAFPISRSAVSKHVRLLRLPRLVRERREGRRRYYELNPAPLREVESRIGQYQKFWQSSLAGLKAVAESEHKRITARHSAKEKKRAL